MDEKEARELLEGSIANPDQDDECYILQPGGEKFISWMKGEKEIQLDGYFIVEELEAIVWWMKNKKQTG
jgi:hypothetical protein